MSRLAAAESPYLRSAAHQPVDWFSWGEEAFARARQQDKPILLDIGAVWCHWCHVIDRESYENPEIAELINRLFIPVKVDRDERPDVDSRYQSAVSAVSGQGGWPLTAFLLPDGRPFYGGTYFPPEDAMGRPGFPRILQAVAEAYGQRRGEVERAATALAEAVAQAEVFAGAREAFDASISAALADAAQAHYDARHGGFGTLPKFPHPQIVDLLLERYQQTRGPRLLEAAEHTLLAMARGGVYDQLAGGFHRYSVDEKWLVPHFEKMSYDNSELLKNYLHGWQVTRHPFLRETAEGIIAWVEQLLSDREQGGFYASQDADYSLDDDGDYFTWTQAEVRAALSPQESRVAELRFDVEPVGEMHHNPAKNVLWIAREAAQIAAELESSESDVRLLLAAAMRKLLAARGSRPIPAIDRTIYVAWNAMFCSSYLEAARVLGGERGARCGSFALKTLDRLLCDCWDAARGFAHRLGGAWLPGTLDDQCFMALALLDAYEATLSQRYFLAAEAAIRRTLEQHWDAEQGGFFDRARDAGPLGGLDVRRKPLQDSPTPSGNAAAVLALVRLHALTGNAIYQERARATLEAFAGVVPRYGMFAASYGLAALLFSRGPIQVVITGRGDDVIAEQLARAAAETFRFGKAILRWEPGTQTAGWLAPALAATLPPLEAAKAAAWVCLGAKCLAPMTKPEEVQAALLAAGSAAAAR
jgi:uncharacterized protein